MQEKQEQLSQEIKTYLASYWDELKNVDLESDFNVLRDSMLEDIKSLLGQQNFIDFYEGYEIMSNAWDQNIKSDLELIGDKGFYVAGRSVEPNYVTKGSGKKRFEVQQGSKGCLIPNDLIAEKLCQSEVETVKDLEMQAADIQSQYDELVEEAKVEDSPEYDALYDYIHKNEEDEPKNAFVKADVVKALKNLDKTDER